MVPGYIFTGKPGFTKKQADLFFPPDFADDFPVAMQVLSGFCLQLVIRDIKVHTSSSIVVSLIQTIYTFFNC